MLRNDETSTTMELAAFTVSSMIYSITRSKQTKKVKVLRGKKPPKLVESNSQHPANYTPSIATGVVNGLYWYHMHNHDLRFSLWTFINTLSSSSVRPNFLKSSFAINPLSNLNNFIKLLTYPFYKKDNSLLLSYKRHFCSYSTSSTCGIVRLPF